MQHLIIAARAFARIRAMAFAATSLLLVFASGCVSYTPATSTTNTTVPQNYFAPRVPGGVSVDGIYTFDSVNSLYYYANFQVSTGYYAQAGFQTFDAGSYTVNQRGLRDLSLTTTYQSANTNGNYEWTPIAHNPALAGGFAVELAGQAGGLVQPSSSSLFTGSVVTPLVAANECPNFKTAQPYQFITIPGPQYTTSLPTPVADWNPSTDTAYGSVDVAGSGDTITFTNIVQYTLPPVAGKAPGAPTYPGASSITGACGKNYAGYLTVIPAVDTSVTVTNPLNGNQYTVYPPQATVAIGPTGLLVEDNGYTGALNGVPSTYYTTYYQNSLGAGVGAIGLPQPSSPLSDSGANAVAGAQYLGYIYDPGYTYLYGYMNENIGTTGQSSHLASFGGITSSTSRCASFAAQTGALTNGIYGGDFTNDDPTTSTDGFGNCDFAIDLGTTQSPNGFYPNVTVWMGANYPANPQSPTATYSFSAVAIAGQLNGKYAIFILGVDSTQPWAIYLLQSN
jgi:hypothetical protein